MKVLRMAALALVTAISSVSVAHAEFRYGPLLGGNVTNFKFKQDLVDVSSQFGGHAGLQTELMFGGIGFGVDFGLLYYMNGANVNLGQKPIWSVPGFGNERVLIHNLQIPVHLRFKWTRMNGLEDYIAPFAYAGPDFNIQLGHSSVKRHGESAFKYSGGDVGVTVGLGVELFRHYQISAGYTWGLTYTLKTRLLEDFSTRCSGLQFRVAYMF